MSPAPPGTDRRSPSACHKPPTSPTPSNNPGQPPPPIPVHPDTAALARSSYCPSRQHGQQRPADPTLSAVWPGRSCTQPAPGTPVSTWPADTTPTSSCSTCTTRPAGEEYSPDSAPKPATTSHPHRRAVRRRPRHHPPPPRPWRTAYLTKPLDLHEIQDVLAAAGATRASTKNSQPHR